MVSISLLTLLVEVSLFLAFLWAMKVFVFTPLLRVMDQRDTQIADDKERSATETVKAEQLERDYAAKMGTVRREAMQKEALAQREAQSAHTETVREVRVVEREELEVVRADSMSQVERERQHYPKLTEELVGIIAGDLGFGGNRE